MNNCLKVGHYPHNTLIVNQKKVTDITQKVGVVKKSDKYHITDMVFMIFAN